MSQFFYNREQIVKKLDKELKPIPLTRKVSGATPEDPEIDEIIPNQFVMEVLIRRDSFNTDAVIRSHMINENQIIVLLNDGHETTEKVPVLKNKLKPAHPQNIVEEKTRVWIQSEISLTGEDVKRYFDKFDI